VFNGKADIADELGQRPVYCCGTIKHNPIELSTAIAERGRGGA
jgi:hypothetical protein